jgi:hypothetical protein
MGSVRAIACWRPPVWRVRSTGCRGPRLRRMPRTAGGGDDARADSCSRRCDVGEGVADESGRHETVCRTRRGRPRPGRTRPWVRCRSAVRSSRRAGCASPPADPSQKPSVPRHRERPPGPVRFNPGRTSAPHGIWHQPPQVSYLAVDDFFNHLTRWNSGSSGGSNCQRSALRSDAEATARTSGSESMAKLTDEQKAARALTRKRDEAVRAEEEHARQQAKQRDWEERGLRLTYEELVAREPCRGCGEAILDGLEPSPGTMHLTPEQKVESDAREAAYQERHGECRAHRWSMGGSRQLHCGFCCPPPPLSPRQIEDLTRLMAGWKKPDPKEMDTWELTLRCDHAVHKVMHHSNQHVYASVVECPECGEPRGILTAERRQTPERTARADAAERKRELRKAQRKLAKLRREARTAEEQIAALSALARPLGRRNREVPAGHQRGVRAAGSRGQPTRRGVGCLSRQVPTTARISSVVNTSQANCLSSRPMLSHDTPTPALRSGTGDTPSR